MNFPDVLVGTLSTPAFWAIFSFTLSFGFTWWFLEKPRKWWVLLALGAVVVVLFDWGGLPFGLAGFVGGIALRLWQASRLFKPVFKARKHRRRSS